MAIDSQFESKSEEYSSNLILEMDGLSTALNPHNATLDPHTKAQFVQKIQYDTALSNAKQLIEVSMSLVLILNVFAATVLISMKNINTACFDRCIPKPGSSLAKGEETCVTQCMEKYMAAWNTVSKAYIDRVKRESAGSR